MLCSILGLRMLNPCSSSNLNPNPPPEKETANPHNPNPKLLIDTNPLSSDIPTLRVPSAVELI